MIYWYIVVIYICKQKEIKNMTYEQAVEKAYRNRDWSDGYIVEKDGDYEVAYNGNDLECAMAYGWKFVGLNK